MLRLMTLTFLGLGWAFYEASGGAAFEPSDVVPSPTLAEAPPVPAAWPPEPSDVAAPATAWTSGAVAAAPARDGWAEGARLVSAPAGRAAAEVVARAAPFDANPLAAPPPGSLDGVFSDLNPAARAGDVRFVRGSRVNMRAGPGTGHGVVGVLERGEAAEVIGRDGGWLLIRARGVEGWMARSMLAPA